MKDINKPVEEEIKKLYELGLIESTEDRSYHEKFDMWCINTLIPQYWDSVVKHFPIEMCEYILSFPQKNYWNVYLYDATKRRLDEHVEGVLLHDQINS